MYDYGFSFLLLALALIRSGFSFVAFFALCILILLVLYCITAYSNNSIPFLSLLFLYVWYDIVGQQVAADEGGIGGQAEMIDRYT